MKARSVIVLGLAGLLGMAGIQLTGGFAAGEASAPGKKAPVVIVIFDEFPTTSLLDRSNQVSKSRFPNFHRLATESTWYPNNTTVAAFTAQAIPAILTGKLPTGSQPDFRQHPDSIYAVMNRSGYRIRNLETYAQLCPPSICPRNGRPIIDPKPGESPHSFGTRVLKSVPNRESERLKWIAGLRRLGSGEAAIGHIKLPHGPYEYLPGGRKYKDIEGHRVAVGKDRLIRRGKPGLIEAYEKRLLMQIGFVDTLLGRIVSSIKRSGQWDETTLVITSDHGVSIRPGLPRRRAVGPNRYSVGLTPLFIKYPGQGSGQRSELMTSILDIVPTVAEALGVEKDLYAADGIPTSRIPEDRTTRINEGQKGVLEFTRAGISRWLKVDARERVKRMGNRGLDALGPSSEALGTQSRVTRNTKRRLLSIPILADLRRRGKGGSLPPLIEGYVRGPAIPKGDRLLLTLDNQIAADASIFEMNGKRAFSFLLHPRYLKARGKRTLKIIWKKRSGRKLRVFRMR